MKKAIVVGASSGIGMEVARLLLKQGWKVGVAARRIGLLSGLSLGGQISPTTKLVLVTGFCGGFTTFSTFMNENLLLGRDGAMLSAVIYTLLSLALGLIAVIIGYQIVK